MLYGDEKALEMARSILPSKKRKAARGGKASARRRNRHSIRQNLHTIADFEEWDEDFDATDDAQHSGVAPTIEVVGMRRDGDKDAPVVRWAEAKADVLGKTPDERVVAMKKLLRASPMGNHALSHIKYLDEYETEPRRFWRYGHAMTAEERVAQAESERALFINKVRANLHRHAELNRHIKFAFDRQRLTYYEAKMMRRDNSFYAERPRLLMGDHDVEAFVDEVLGAKRVWRVEERGYVWVGYLRPAVMDFFA